MEAPCAPSLQSHSSPSIAQMPSSSSCLYKANDGSHSKTNIGEKHNDVAGRVASVPLDHEVWNIELGANIDVRSLQRSVFTIIRDSAIRSTVPYTDIIAPISVGLTAAGNHRIIRSHQGAKPLAHDWVAVFPLTEIFGVG